ncbi:hypothetical protein [Wenzhouxiangella sp. XN24]|uniref:hypothetical protein n=1 Tax=Wenzhouxiangella sp. XN24 TaxID=2713569 RepID=UPI0013EBF51F|nr:hypothetical protein [Wenzhouxiangella sp. XN24]NGX16303.1 hypothetical protein [Wenzhouxiangella sp. XN24]
MRHRMLKTLLGLVMALHGMAGLAELADIRATPAQLTLLAASNNVVQVRWQVATTPDHTSGVFSPPAAILDPSTGGILQRVDTSLEAAGTGPFVLRETLRLDAGTVRGWLDEGIQRVVLERSFADDVGRARVARVVLRLSGSRLQSIREGAPSELEVVSLRLEFETGNNTAIVAPETSLQAALTVQHTGTGVLRGRWQIAEPGSSEVVPVFRTLALVNAQVRAGQRSYYRSPVLPTGQAGIYALRFCVSNPDLADPGDDLQCPDSTQIVYGSYQVQPQDTSRPVRIRGLAPDRSRAGPETPFRWDAVRSAATYQFQVFEFALHTGEGDPVPPRFVGGVLIPGEANHTPLGASLVNKLVPGERYLWRVTAHDETGRTVGSSVEATFIFGLAD